jgi:hypothetical protein
MQLNRSITEHIELSKPNYLCSLNFKSQHALEECNLIDPKIELTESTFVWC